MQLAATRSLLMALAALTALPPLARAEDRVDFTTTWYQERRRGGLGGLTVIHPQFDLGLVLGEKVVMGAGYSADVVSGATAAVYAVDAVSSATTFDDTRHEARMSLGFRGSRSNLTIGAGAGVERDYTSITVGAGAEVDMPGRNTTLALSYTRNFDNVCDRDNTMVGSPREKRALTGFDECRKNRVLFGEDLPGTTVWHSIGIDTAQATVTQNLTPTANMQAALFGQVLQGFQSSPYRKVRLGNTEPQETVPDVRGRAALLLRVNKFFPGVRSAVHGSVRGYSDTWGVNSVALEGGYSQYVGPSLLVRFRARAYQQSAAKFFKDAFFYQTQDTAGAFFTGDRELAPVRNLLVGARLTYIAFNQEGGSVLGVFDEIRVNLKGELLSLDERAADPSDANLAGIGNQFLTSGQLLDAFILQIGILMRY